jgi:glycosyltransferase involved in cell wall biosynthesis
MRLTVLSVAFPFAPVGPDAVGGAEQILSAIDRGLVRAGHRSVVVACEGSQTAGFLFATKVFNGLITSEIGQCTTQRHQHNIDIALRSFDVDLIHFHGIDFSCYRFAPGIPVLATLHLPLSWYPRQIWTQNDCNVHLYCVSESQRRACPVEDPSIPVIPNGVEITPSARHSKRNFALALGRICPEKNLHVALDAGTLAKVPVLLGGQVFPYADHLRYFREKIAPRLQGSLHRFLGPLTAAHKTRLLQAARCLLLPSLAPETSSLVAIESLAAGTPVIAFPSGAIPEIVRDGLTGFLVHNVSEMAEAIHRVHEIDPAICRADAAQRFSLQRMLRDYFSLYEQLVRGNLTQRVIPHATASLPNLRADHHH